MSTRVQEPETTTMTHTAVAAAAPRPVSSLMTFDELFTVEYPIMVKLATAMLSDRARAEEVVQEAFVKAHDRWGALDNPAGFVRVCVVNGCRSVWRRDAVLRRIFPKVVASAVVIQFDNNDQMRDAVAKLPYRQRAVVVMKFYAQMSEREIAETLDIPAGTVKSTTHRALAALREMLPEEEIYRG